MRAPTPGSRPNAIRPRVGCCAGLPLCSRRPRNARFRDSAPAARRPRASRRPKRRRTSPAGRPSRRSTGRRRSSSSRSTPTASCAGILVDSRLGSADRPPEEPARPRPSASTSRGPSRPPPVRRPRWPGLRCRRRPTRPGPDGRRPGSALRRPDPEDAVDRSPRTRGAGRSKTSCSPTRGSRSADEVGRQLGREPVRRRDRAREARARAWPRLAGLLALAVIVAVFRAPAAPGAAARCSGWPPPFRPRSSSSTAALAIRRTLYRALRALRSRRRSRGGRSSRPPSKRSGSATGPAARTAWMRALEAGATAAQVYYQMGLARPGRRRPPRRAERFRARSRPRSLRPRARRRSSPRWRSREGRGGDARALLERYIREAGPDPETLATLAVVQANAGDGEGAARTIREARALLPEGWRRAELEAQIYARAGDAAATVAALRPLQAEGRLDRGALRADPAYVPIATDPAWVAFLAERRLTRQLCRLPARARPPPPAREELLLAPSRLLAQRFVDRSIRSRASPRCTRARPRPAGRRGARRAKASARRASAPPSGRGAAELASSAAADRRAPPASADRELLPRNPAPRAPLGEALVQPPRRPIAGSACGATHGRARVREPPPRPNRPLPRPRRTRGSCRRTCRATQSGTETSEK